jgi:PQQ-dependent dehydrogenase (s-GDH family)
MKRIVAVALAAMLLGTPAIAQDLPSSVVAGKQQFDMKVLAENFASPWEITWGPDDFLWVTERTAGRIVRVDPRDGSKHVAAQVSGVYAPGGQDGLLGLALDPGLLKGTGHDYVYTAYTYEDKSLGADETVTDPYSPYRYLYTKIIRLTYDAKTQMLGDPLELIAGMPASSDHNSGRMKVGPDGKLYYTIGDGGNDQLGNWCIPIQAQRLPTADEVAAKNWFAYQGKSLRLNLDGSIPDDNPEINGVRSHIYTYGHRNMQGIDFAPDGTLYASEQGPKTDDEINILLPGRNYGWPHVAGFRDDKAYQYARWKDATTPCEQLQFSDITIDPSVPKEDESSWKEPMQDPVATMFTVPSDWDFTDPVCKGVDFICWPTVAASSIEAYMPKAGEGIPGWENSLIVTTLKRGSIYRAPLAADGKSLRGPFERYFQSQNRFRDTAFSPDKKTIYVITDNGGLAEALAGGTTTTMHNPGQILVFTYKGDGSTAEATPAPASASSSAETSGAAAGTPPVFTAKQAERGSVAYASNCSTCHGQNLISATYGTPLAGQYFDGKWRGQTVAALLAYAHKMPPSRPGSLPDATYADIVAHILAVNGFAPGATELPADPAALATMTITPKAP